MEIGIVIDSFDFFNDILIFYPMYNYEISNYISENLTQENIVPYYYISVLCQFMLY